MEVGKKRKMIGDIFNDSQKDEQVQKKYLKVIQAIKLAFNGELILL